MDVQSIDTVLFDFGGTLDAPGVHWLTRFHRLYPQVGLAVAPERITEAFYWADAQLLAHPEITTLQFLPLMLEHAALQLRYLDLPAHPYQQQLAAGFCDAARRSLQVSVDVLTALRQRFTLGVISNFYGNVTTLCQECGLAALCDVIIDSAQVGVSKPAAAYLHPGAGTAWPYCHRRQCMWVTPSNVTCSEPERLDCAPSGCAAWSHASALIRPWSMPPSRRWKSCQPSWL